jgi:hypothetical protein
MNLEKIIGMMGYRDDNKRTNSHSSPHVVFFPFLTVLFDSQ